jgi:hypothetical protein
MKFFMSFTPSEEQAKKPPSPEMMAEMGKLVEAETKAGVLLATGGLLPVSMGGARLRCSGGELTVVDGPFAETKEQIAGWAIVQVASREEAIEASRRFFKVAGDGEGEIRRIMDPSEGPASR